MDTPISYASRRWAQALVGLLGIRHDPKTVEVWSRSIGASAASIRQWCRAAGLRPKASLDLARLLRAIYLAGDGPWELYDLLDIVDERTMRQLFRRGGLTPPVKGDAAPDRVAFLRTQTFVPPGAALAALIGLVERLHPRDLAGRTG